MTPGHKSDDDDQDEYQSDDAENLHPPPRFGRAGFAPYVGIAIKARIGHPSPFGGLVRTAGRRTLALCNTVCRTEAVSVAT